MSHVLHVWQVSAFDQRYLTCTVRIKAGSKIVPCPARTLNPERIQAPAQQHSPTSVKAADQVQTAMGAMLRAVLGEFVQVGAAGLTDDELIARMGRPNTVRPRRVDLHRLGYIRDSHQTRTTASGRDAVVWVVTDEGMAWSSRK